MLQSYQTHGSKMYSCTQWLHFILHTICTLNASTECQVSVAVESCRSIFDLETTQLYPPQKYKQNFYQVLYVWFHRSGLPSRTTLPKVTLATVLISVCETSR